MITKEKKETKCDDLIDALLEKHGKSFVGVFVALCSIL
jgi:hypothetical protein